MEGLARREGKRHKELVSIRRFLLPVLLALVPLALAPVASADAAGKKRPCYKHTTETVPTKKTCLAAYKRSRMAWPPKPTEAEIKNRVGSYHWNKAARVANCETGGTRGATKYRGNLNWHLTGTYQGPLGMYRQTAAYGKRATGYWGPRLTWQQWVAVAVASHPITRGWSGWGCGSA